MFSSWTAYQGDRKEDFNAEYDMRRTDLYKIKQNSDIRLTFRDTDGSKWNWGGKLPSEYFPSKSVPKKDDKRVLASKKSAPKPVKEKITLDTPL